MESKSTDWRPGNTVCRCCLTEGCYKDISTEYFWMGKREVYSEMLTETFDLNIAFSKSGGPNSNSRLICEPCISRLRDASDFKRQVQECERTFMQFLDPGSSGVMTEVELDKEVKIEAVKLEEASDEDLFDDRDFGTMDDDDDDDLDDQPLTKLASKIPKKESVDIMELLDSAKVGDKRKASTKLKVSPTKKVSSRIIKITGKEVKVKNKKLLVKATTSSKEPKATVSKLTVKPEKKKKEESYEPARRNAETILRCTTAYPFRVNDKSILCVFCQELHDDPDVFRQHMDKEHSTFSLKVAFYNLPKLEFIKADVTSLKCRLCEEKLDDLDSAVAHLTQRHGQTIDTNAKFGVMPYRLNKDVFVCAVCNKSFPSLFHLNRHTITHFLIYVCDVCGSSYVATTGLLRHMRSKHQEYKVSCKNCQKVFPNMEAKEKHRRTEKSCMPYCCLKCSERFHDFRVKKRHMETVHGQTSKMYRCSDCDLYFTSEGNYYEHFRLQHSDNCVVCKHCGLKFLSHSRLKRHLAKHSV